VPGDDRSHRRGDRGADPGAASRRAGRGRQDGPGGARGVDGQGDSAPFLLSARGQFAPGSSDFRLVYRARADRQWTVGSDAQARLTPRQVPLRLRSRASSLHGRRLEVRALAFPPGRLDAVTTFTQPLDLGRDVTISPEPVMAFPVTTRADRLGPAQLLPNAVIVRGGDAAVGWLAAEDLRQLGMTDGALAELSQGGRTLRIVLRAADAPALALATLMLPGSAAEHLGLALSETLAGYTIGIVPAPAGAAPTRPGGWGQ